MNRSDLKSSFSAWMSKSARFQFAVGSCVLTQFSPGEIDTLDLYTVRNDPAVRTFMPDPSPLPLEAHKSWVEKNLVLGDRIMMFIARDQTGPVGFSLLKEIAPDTAELGVMFIGAYQHTLIPAQVAVATGLIAVERLNKLWLVTYADKNHKLALKLNRGMGLTEVQSDKEGEICFRTSANTLLTNPLSQKLVARLNKDFTIIAG